MNYESNRWSAVQGISFGCLMMLVILAAACGRDVSPPEAMPPKVQDQGIGLREAVGLWSNGATSEAEEKFLSIDWQKGGALQDGWVLALTEQEFMSRAPEGTGQKSKEMRNQFTALMGLGRHLIQKGRETATTDKDEARRILLAVQNCATFLASNPDGLVIVKQASSGLSGLATEALEELE